ncbi:MAG: methionyl-tRNA formyltransferase [Spirochaetales bacterium]|nr:methionyl-tRNA formyltransferase [Spirochaetales bacterium]
MTRPRILFAGTPEISVPLLKALAQRFEVAGVLTSCDKSSGRSGKPVPSPVKSAALELGLPVLQFDSIRTEAREAVKKLGADTLVSFAFGRIFGPRFLELFPNGKFNVHPSDLPAFRGPAPIQFTILEGLRQATVSLQSLGLKMDEGDIWGKTAIDLDGTETTQSLSETVAERAASFVPELLEDIIAGKVSAVPQQGGATYCTMISRETGSLDFSETVREVHCRIRACYPWPKAWSHVNGGDIAVTGVWGGFPYLENPDPCEEGTLPGTVVAFRKDRGIGVACGDGIIWLSALQLPAKKELDFKSFVNGNRWILDSRFG